MVLDKIQDLIMGVACCMIFAVHISNASADLRRRMADAADAQAMTRALAMRLIQQIIPNVLLLHDGGGVDICPARAVAEVRVSEMLEQESASGSSLYSRRGLHDVGGQICFAITRQLTGCHSARHSEVYGLI